MAFSPNAPNLVSGDTNLTYDIFVHDHQTGYNTRVSVASDGTQGNEDFWSPSISSDGRYVAFRSYSTNLVSGDLNLYSDVFVHDQQNHQTTRVSVASDGTQGNDYSGISSISSDGRFVAFSSRASNLVSGDTNNNEDVFIHDLQTGETTRISVASDGTQGNYSSVGPSISADGRYVAFESASSNLVNGDTNYWPDIFVHDRLTGETTRVSVDFDGSQIDLGSYYPSISSDGRYVAFTSFNNYGYDSDVFVHDLQTGETTCVSLDLDGNVSQGSYVPSISSDGRYVAFKSRSSYLVSNDTNGVDDVFVNDRQTGKTTRISVASDGTEGNQISGNGAGSRQAISSDGNYVAFTSDASNLVSGDTNGLSDIFVHENGITNHKSWTLIYYLDGDTTFADGNPLDRFYSIPIIRELSKEASNANINIVTLLDQYGDNNSAYYLVNSTTDPSNSIFPHTKCKLFATRRIKHGGSTNPLQFCDMGQG